MASTKRTWLWVVLGIMGTLALLVVAVIGGAIFEFRRHVRTEFAEKQTAEQEFDRQRARFAGQQPLIEFVDGKDDRHDVPTVHRPPASARRVKIQALRVLIYSFVEGRLIHADVPGWLLRAMPSRAMPSGAMRTAPSSRGGGFDADFDMRQYNLSIEDLERHGLGLVLESQNRDARILIWSE
jgi:hypothetical protein